MSFRAYVLHLERAEGRKRQVAELLAALPLSAEIVPATDGLLMGDADLERHFRRYLHLPRYPFVISRTEIACFLTHRRAWQRIIDDGCDAGLVVEDDVAVASPSFARVVETATSLIGPDEFLRFPLRERGERGGVVHASGAVSIIEPRLPALGMQMQLVGREAARRLLAATKLFDRPVDSVVQMQWVHAARVLSVRPIVIREIGRQLGGSVIHRKRTGVVHKFVHEVQRPLIRRAIRHANEVWRRKSA